MIVEDWGLVEYELSSARQLEYVDAVATGAEERLVFCTHPPVVTLGRATLEGDLTGWTGATAPASRGGRATYHGPNQIVIYPILDLRQRGRDVHAYLRSLEHACVLALREFGLRAEARTAGTGENSLTGVWVGERKIASIGIAVRKWVTYHGIAINVTEDPLAHRGIKPCGFSTSIMTSMEAELGRALSRDQVSEVFKPVFRSQLDRAALSLVDRNRELLHSTALHGVD